jgi:hypothetical protein
MARFMLLLHDNPGNGADASPEEIQAIIGEYVAWRRGIESSGKLVGGEKLADEGGRDLSLADGELRVVDGPFSEAKEVVGGYFTIEAADYDEAIAIASDCPHLKYGSRIELRQIDAIDH